MINANRLTLRREQWSPLIDEFNAWLDERNENRQVLPQSSICKAIRDALGNFPSTLVIAAGF